MSIQDESFPHDELLSKLDFSFNKSGRFKYPKLQRQATESGQQMECLEMTMSLPAVNARGAQTNSSASSNEDNLSTESINGRPSSVLSTKTTSSDPTGFEDESKKCRYNAEETLAKATSCQNVHSEYTKRRYKHVQSKVGQYIAQMKAEDEKRRNTKFQRHRSLPETFISGDAPQPLHSHECSDDAVANTDFIDKSAYAQLVNENDRIQSYSDYLQNRLDEKIGENVRLKHNMDYLRIELTNCQDKLKRQSIQRNQTGMRNSLQSLGSWGGGIGDSNGALERQSTQSLLYYQPKIAKATQTEEQSPPPSPPPPPPPPSPQPPPLPLSEVIQVPLQLSALFTPISTADANNNVTDDTINAINNITSTVVGPAKGDRVVAAIKPISLNFSSIADQSHDDSHYQNGVLRQRLNASQQQPLHLTASSAGERRSDSDAAIGVGLAELVSRSMRQRQRHGGAAEQIAAGEFVYYNARTGCYAMVPGGANYAPCPQQCSGLSSETVGASQTSSAGTSKKPSSLRRRWFRFFAPCGGCQEPNDSFIVDASGNSVHLLLARNAERSSL